MSIREDKVLLPTFSCLGITHNSNGQVVIPRLNMQPEVYAQQSPAVQKLLYISEREKAEVVRYINLDNMTRRVVDAFVVAHNALSFNDKSDYQIALSQVCEILNPTVSK